MGTPGRALEIGCGEGWMLAALKEAGWKVVGTERTITTAQFAAKQKGLQMVVASLEAFRPEPLFDLIVMHHVLEHLPNPMTILAQCSTLLRPGGTLLLAVPNLQSWQFTVSGKNWFHLDVPRHLTHFTPASISQALDRAGLTIEAIKYKSWDQDPFGWMVSLLNLLGFPQTRWLHWLANQERDPSPVNILMLIFSPVLLVAGFIIAPASWLFRRGSCMEVRARKESRIIPPIAPNHG
jgi:SAM-dependent methyltransferase